MNLLKLFMINLAKMIVFITIILMGSSSSQAWTTSGPDGSRPCWYNNPPCPTLGSADLSEDVGIPHLYTFYLNIFDNRSCAITPANSTYFEPKIQVFYRSCFGGFCSCDQTTLSAWGECKWIEANAIARFCGRATPPGAHGNHTDTQYMQLSVNQIPYNGPCPTGSPNDETKCQIVPRVQICAYRDPTDFMDITDGVSPYGSMDPNPAASSTVINLLNGSDGAVASGVMAGAVVALLYVAPEVGVMAMVALACVALVEVIEKNENQIVEDPSANFLVNPAYVLPFVDNAPVGCVEYPAAPPPPPFCPQLKQPQLLPLVTRVCGVNESASLLNRCVSTYATKNPWGETVDAFEKNLIRVGFNNYVQACSSTNTTYCVNFKINGSYITNNTALPTGTDLSALVYQCSSSPDLTKPCVEFVGTPTSPFVPATPGPYRLAFYYKINGVLSTPDNYYINDTGNPVSEAVLFGINDANFYDLGFAFNSSLLASQLSSVGTNSGGLLNYNNLDPASTSYNSPSIIFDNSTNRQFFAYIDLNNSQEICAYEKNADGTAEYISCKDRPDMPRPSVAPCGVALCDPNNSSNCAPASYCSDRGYVSTNTMPKMVVGVGNPMQFGVVGKSLNNNSILSGAIDPLASLYLYGTLITTTVTDANYATLSNYTTIYPSATCTANQTCTQAQVLPYYDPNGKFIGDPSPAGYLSGLEFYQGLYARGGTQICIKGYKTQEQVLAKIVNVAGNNVVSTQTGDRILPPPTPVLVPDPTPMSPSDITKSFIQYQSQICYVGRVIPACMALSSDGTTVDKTKCCSSCAGTAGFTPNPSCNNSVVNTCPANECPDSGGNCIPNVVCNAAGGICACPSPYLTPAVTHGNDLSYIVSSSTEGVRPKQPWENGLCAPVPPPSDCPAIVNGDQNQGNASWSSASPGAIGAFQGCNSGYLQDVTTPTITCYPNQDTGAWGLANACLPGCTGENFDDADWPTTMADEIATGSCSSGYKNSAAGAPTRACLLNGNSAFWSNTVTNPCAAQVACPEYYNPSDSVWCVDSNGNNTNFYSYYVYCDPAFEGDTCYFFSGSYPTPHHYVNFNLYLICQANGTWGRWAPGSTLSCPGR